MTPLQSSLRTTLSLLALATLVAAVAVSRLGVAGWSSLSRIQASFVIGILVLSMLLLASALAGQMAPGSKPLIPLALLLAVPVVALALAAAELFPYVLSPAFVPVGLSCFIAGVACAAGAAPLFWMVLRRGFPLSPRAHGATAGLLAGLTGVSVLTIECSYLETPHIPAWHVGAAVAAAALGACAGLFLRARQRPLA